MLGELARRVAAGGRRIEEIRKQIAALTSQMQDEQDRLSRLTITRETVEEILGEAAQLLDEPTAQAGTADAASAAPPVLSVGMVSHWQPGMKAEVLPRAYRDAMEIMTDAGRAIRAGQIAVAMGLPHEAAKWEGLRSKLKRLAERGAGRGAHQMQAQAPEVARAGAAVAISGPAGQVRALSGGARAAALHGCGVDDP